MKRISSRRIVLIGIHLIGAPTLHCQIDDPSLDEMLAVRSNATNELGVHVVATPFRNVGLWYAHWWHDVFATSLQVEAAPFGGHLGLIVRPLPWFALGVEAGFTDYSILSLHSQSFEPDISIRIAPELRLSLGPGENETFLSVKAGMSALYDGDLPSDGRDQWRREYLVAFGIGFGF